MLTARCRKLLPAALALAWLAPAWTSAGAPLSLEKPLLAWYPFDEPLGGRCADISGKGADAAVQGRYVLAIDRAEGVFGNALRLAGRHRLEASAALAFGPMEAITLCAWTLPAELDDFREIFRKEDGEDRVLFSFQEGGTVLSLGLNVGGYVECDAPIDPAAALDGAWHHCAATFDGRHFRVYFDGKLAGELARPGTIQAGGLARGCIGSLEGSECFQGLLDDFRIYAAALSADEIAALHRNGREALAARPRERDGGEPDLPRRLLAHWTFNEAAGATARDRAGSTGARDARAQRPLPRVTGVHGNAIELRGEHALAVALGPDLAAAAAGLSIAVWARPAELGGFREIFRQECDARILFSFQENGTILSFGLNAGGYVECDAPIDPARLLDGNWHHCAAVFDGAAMRVYLDGAPIGVLERAGPATLDPAAPAHIGSLSGKREHFQGALDDLRIYSEALEAQEIARLHRAGRARLEERARGLQQALGEFYRREATFAETLARAGAILRAGRAAFDRELAGAFTRALAADFPEESRRLGAVTGAHPLDYLASAGDGLQTRAAEHAVELLMEYAPLTPEQKADATLAEREHWRAAEAIRARLDDLKSRGEAARDAPDWIQIVLDAGPMITPRPATHEAVAPYVRPETPATRTLSAAEADAALRRDWLYQADGSPTPERILREIEWARKLARRIAPAGAPDLAPELAELDTLAARAAVLKAPDAELYCAVRGVKRAIAFKNSVVDFDKVPFVDMPYPQGSEWPHETRHRLGYMAVPGGRLLVLEGLSPAGRLAQLMPKAPLHGSFWRPDLSWDGRQVLVCFKPHNEKSFHLYEIGIDGEGLRQLTKGPFDDLDPIYLPDGKHLMFSTTRAHTYVRCMPPTNAYILARCDRDGRNIYLISRNNEPDYLPSVLDDGRVIYTRWEYTDKPLWRPQKLWSVNPDGTQAAMFWGNQSVWPDLVKDARQIPGTTRVMATGSAHHNWFAGSVAIIDIAAGLNFPYGITKVTADVAWPECGNGPVDPIESPEYHASGKYGAYYSPYPLGEHDFLVSAERNGKFVLLLMDTEGNRELVYEGTHHIFHAMPVRARPAPPVIPDRVAWPAREDRLRPAGGTIYSANVYEGTPAELHGKARFLRVLSIDSKTYTYWYKRPYISTGPVVSAVQSEGVKRILGTVPIEPDGAVAFRAPAGRALHFQLLDERGRALQTMRSFTGVMPGERRGCLGCHELHSRAPANEPAGGALAAPVRAIAPPPWSDVTVSFPRYVQPVLDTYCGKCHQGEGEARATLDLTSRPAFDVFTEPYLTLIGRPTWGRPYERPADAGPGFGIANVLMVEGFGTLDPRAYVTPPPMTHLSYNSPLIEIASSGAHHGVKVDEVSLARLVAWIDAMCPYMGDDEIRRIEDPVFQGVDWLAIRPRIRTAPVIVRPGPVD